VTVEKVRLMSSGRVQLTLMPKLKTAVASFFIKISYVFQIFSRENQMFLFLFVKKANIFDGVGQFLKIIIRALKFK